MQAILLLRCWKKTSWIPPHLRQIENRRPRLPVPVVKISVPLFSRKFLDTHMYLNPVFLIRKMHPAPRKNEKRACSLNGVLY